VLLLERDAMPTASLNRVWLTSALRSFFCLSVAASQTTKRNIELLFVRGDAVILISPPLRMA